MKTRMKRIGSLILALLLLFTTLAVAMACGTVPEEPEPVLIDLIVNGATNYQLIRSETASAEVKKAFSSLGKTLREMTGLSDLEMADDFVPRDSEPPTDTPEILVGLTNRQESIDVHAQLAVGEYAITMVGKRLVIVGYGDEETIDAIQYFMEQMLTANVKDGNQEYLDAAEKYLNSCEYTENGVIYKGELYESLSFSGAGDLVLMSRFGYPDALETVMAIEGMDIDDCGFAACSDLNPYFLGKSLAGAMNVTYDPDEKKQEIKLGEYCIYDADGNVSISYTPYVYINNPYNH